MCSTSVAAVLSRNSLAFGSASHPDAIAFRLNCWPEFLAAFVIVCLSFCAEATAFQDAAVSTNAEEVPAARRIAVVICGHPGDADHVELFQGSVEKIQTGLTTHYQFATENIHVFMGDEEDSESSEADFTGS